MAVPVFLTIWIFPIRCFGSTATSFSFFSDRLRFPVEFFLNRWKKGQHPFTPQLHVLSAEGFGVALALFSVRFVSLAQCFVWQFYFLPQLFRFLFNIWQNRKERIEAPAKNISRIKYSVRKIVEQLLISWHGKSRLGFFASFLLFVLWNSKPTLVRHFIKTQRSLIISFNVIFSR